MITTIYRVEVPIPDNVVGFLNGPEYRDVDKWRTHWDPIVEDATAGALRSGSDDNGTPFEWAEFEVLSEARRCEDLLSAGIQSVEEQMK